MFSPAGFAFGSIDPRAIAPQKQVRRGTSHAIPGLQASQSWLFPHHKALRRGEPQCKAHPSTCTPFPSLVWGRAWGGGVSFPRLGAYRGHGITPVLLEGQSQGCIGRGEAPPPPLQGAQPTQSLWLQVPASMAFVTNSNRPQSLWQPPPTAYLTASGAVSEVPSRLTHPWSGAHSSTTDAGWPLKESGVPLFSCGSAGRLTSRGLGAGGCPCPAEHFMLTWSRRHPECALAPLI